LASHSAIAVGSLLLAMLFVGASSVAPHSADASAVSHPTPIVLRSRKVETPSPAATITLHPRKEETVTLTASITTEEREEEGLLPIVDRSEIRRAHRTLLDEVLRALPPTCRDALKYVSVLYDKPDHRGLASKDTIILDGTLPESELRAVFIHELGHIADLGCLTGTERNGVSAYRDGKTPMFTDDPSVAFYQISWSDAKTRKSQSAPEDFVSGYARSSDVFEDLAESYAFAILHRAEFEERAKDNEALMRKLLWLKTYLLPEEIEATSSTFAAPTNRIVWDVTKLPYQWVTETQEIAAR
jgi:hypothetical protein